MSNSKHTPGPWKVWDHAPYSVWLGDKSQVAACRWTTDDGKPEPECVQSDAEAQANARLIASAPDLLAALKRLIDNPGPRKADDEFVAHKKLGAHIEAVSAARAAIAKAEGR